VTTRRSRIALLGLGALALAAAWLAASRQSTPPLYDGVGFPDEPYRYVVAPHGVPATAPPGAAIGDANVVNGQSQTASAGSNEQGPQVQLIIDQGDITAPAGATVVHLRAEPAAPTGQPPDATIWGNVYRLSAASDKGPAQIHAGADSTTVIALRAPVGPTPEPVMEYFDGASWHRLPVTRIGNDFYVSPIAGVGDYALATLPGQSQPVPGATPTADRSGIDRWVLVPGIALLILIVAIAVIRWTRSPYRRVATDMIDTESLVTFSRMSAATAATMELSADQETTVTDTARRLLGMATAATPDPRQLRDLAEELLAALRTAGPTLASRTAITLGENALRGRRT